MYCSCCRKRALKTKRGRGRGQERGATLLDLLCVNTRTVSIDSLYPSVRVVFCISHLVARISELGSARAAYYPATVNVVSWKNAVNSQQRGRGKHFLSLWPSTKLELVKRHTFLCHLRLPSPLLALPLLLLLLL